MPKTKIDYSNTHFYKIVCKDLDIKDFYIGHTTDFKTRNSCHKRVCNNPKSNRHHLPVYKFIRENGGYENFQMVLMETLSLNNSLEARARERELTEQHKPTLNKFKPYTSVEEKKIYKQEWTETHMEEVKEYKHNWHLQNKERNNEKGRENYHKNREERLQRAKDNYQNNIDEKKEIRNRKCECECGDTYTYSNKRRHERTTKHQQYLQSLE